MFCAQCGTAIKDGAKFCGKCGWAIAQQQQPTPVQAAPVQAPPVYTPPPASPYPPQQQAQSAPYTGQTPYQQPPQYQAPPPYPGQPYPAQYPPPQYQRTAVPAVDFSADKGIGALKVLSITAPLVYVVGALVFSVGQIGETVFAIAVSLLIFGGLFTQSLFALIKGVKYKKIALIVVSIIALLYSVFLFVVQL